ncbi:MAG: NADH-quinone oxidoreductase subunit H, partial [Planctomycetia bacterium]|nr:NADH-quinone oxidoreductase subunit H [Planctomycetia bacterium]
IGCAFGMIGFLAKTYILITIMMWARWSLPRLRVDQVMTMCLKYCFPIAAVMFLGTMFWMAAFPNGVFACCGCGCDVSCGTVNGDGKTSTDAETVENRGDAPGASPSFETYLTPSTENQKSVKGVKNADAPAGPSREGMNGTKKRKTLPTEPDGAVPAPAPGKHGTK